MFILYDLNMKRIPFPDGIVPLDIFVSSIAKERQTETIPGRVGVADYGSEYRERSVDLSLMIKSYNAMFYRTQRNRLYELFSEHDVFYIAESHLPSRVLKVAVDDSYIPERISGNAYASTAEITCRTLDSVFWESIYTTKELNDTGYDAAVAKYGLVDNIDSNQTQYKFEPTRSTQSLINESFKYGFLSGTTGKESTSKSNIITSDYVRVYPGIEYEFEDTGTHPTLDYWWIYEYDDSNNFIKWTATNKGDNRKRHIFIAEGSKLRFMANPNSGQSINLEGVGNDIRPYLRRDAMNNSFSVYNAGNVTVEPESMYLNIFTAFVTSNGDFTIRNKSTGEEMVLERESNGSHFRLSGMNVSLGGITNILRDTNRQFIRLVPGDNEFEVLNGTFEYILVDFKFYFK